MPCNYTNNQAHPKYTSEIASVYPEFVGILNPGFLHKFKKNSHCSNSQIEANELVSTSLFVNHALEIKF